MIFRILKKEGGGHTYDEWNTEGEVIKVLTKYGGKIERKIGICFIPSHFTYKLPFTMKNLIIKITSLIENRIRWKLHWCGYMVEVSAIKDIYVENHDPTKVEG